PNSRRDCCAQLTAEEEHGCDASFTARTVCFHVFFQAEDGIRDRNVTGVQTCALPIYAQALAMAAGAGGAAGVGLGAAAAGGDGDAHGLIALAQRVHDEHVAEGERKRDELIKGAEKEAADIVGKAESKRDETLSTLESQKSTL